MTMISENFLVSINFTLGKVYCIFIIIILKLYWNEINFQNYVFLFRRSVSDEIDRLHQEVNSYVEQMQQLRGTVNDLKEQKNKMCSDLQKKSSLLEQLDAITKENTELAESVKVNIYTLYICYLRK